MKNVKVLLLLVLVCLAGFVSCSKKETEAAPAAVKKIYVAHSQSYVPYDFVNDKNLTGLKLPCGAKLTSCFRSTRLNLFRLQAKIFLSVLKPENTMWVLKACGQRNSAARNIYFRKIIWVRVL